MQLTHVLPQQCQDAAVAEAVPGHEPGAGAALCTRRPAERSDLNQVLLCCGCVGARPDGLGAVLAFLSMGRVSKGLTVLISLQLPMRGGAAGSGWSARRVASTNDLKAADVLPQDDCQREELPAGKESPTRDSTIKDPLLPKPARLAMPDRGPELNLVEAADKQAQRPHEGTDDPRAPRPALVLPRRT
jgi:hypothetical protein